MVNIRAFASSEYCQNPILMVIKIPLNHFLIILNKSDTSILMQRTEQFDKSRNKPLDMYTNIFVFTFWDLLQFVLSWWLNFINFSTNRSSILAQISATKLTKKLNKHFELVLVLALHVFWVTLIINRLLILSHLRDIHFLSHFSCKYACCGVTVVNLSDPVLQQPG